MGARQLTSHPSPESIGEEHVYRAGPPRWSPDGKQITYISWRGGNSEQGPVFVRVNPPKETL